MKGGHGQAKIGSQLRQTHSGKLLLSLFGMLMTVKLLIHLKVCSGSYGKTSRKE